MVSAIQAINIAPKGGLAASVPAGAYTRTEVSPTDSTCNFQFSSDGTWIVTDDFGSTGSWETGTGTGADYWIRWTTTSGALTTGTAGSWLQLSTSRVFGKTRTLNGAGTDSVTGTVEIATDAAGANIIATGSITLNATVEL